MLVAKVAFPVAVLFLAGLAESEERRHSRLSRVLRSSDDRSSRQAQPDWYLEQCRFVNAWKEQLGHVSVLTFLDPAWQYSFRQTVMLELLISRLRKSGFPDIRFFVITPPSDRTEDETDEDDLEIEAWQEIGAKYDMDSFVDHHFLKGNRSEITFLRDDSRSRMWERFRASKDQVIVIDRCGKLTYHVIVPWSILYFPYVKAAILSTYREDPCGGCDPTIYQAANQTGEEEASSQRETNGVNANPVWTTERLENAAIDRGESSPEEEREMNTVSSILPEGITDNTDHPNLSSTTEPATYQYDNGGGGGDGATESWLDEGPPDAEGTRDREDPTDSEGSAGTVTSEIAVTFEPQRDTSPREQAGSHSQTSVSDDSLTPANYEDTTDRILLLDEPAAGETESDSVTADERPTTLHSADETQGGNNATPEDAERLGEDALMPLRIIMHAPHVHKNGRELKKHTYLILKAGDPDFHGHLDPGVDVAPPTDSWQDANSRITSSEEYDWRTTEAKKENANQKYTFDRDESPGLYGEVADYWKSYGDNDITDRNETFNDTYNNSTISYNEEHHTNISDHAMSFSKSSEESYSVANATEDPNTESSTDPQNIVASSTIESSKPINMNDHIDGEEEMRYNLIVHYNKLLSWIDYRLNK